MFTLYDGDMIVGTNAGPMAYDDGQGGWTVGKMIVPDLARRMVVREQKLRLSRTEFKMQFSQSERMAISTARKYSGTDAAQIQLADTLNDFFDLLEDQSLSYVDLTNATVVAGVNSLVTAGILTSDRPAQILAGVEV